MDSKRNICQIYTFSSLKISIKMLKFVKWEEHIFMQYENKFTEGTFE